MACGTALPAEGRFLLALEGAVDPWLILYDVRPLLTDAFGPAMPEWAANET